MTTAMEMRLRKSQLLCHQLRALFELMYRYPVQQAGDNLDIACDKRRSFIASA